MHAHPQPDDQGQPVFIRHPHKPSPPATWLDPTALATFIPEGGYPGILNGIRLAPWTEAPKNHAGWVRLAAGFDFPEPAFDPKGLKGLGWCSGGGTRWARLARGSQQRLRGLQGHLFRRGRRTARSCAPRPSRKCSRRPASRWNWSPTSWMSGGAPPRPATISRDASAAALRLWAGESQAVHLAPLAALKVLLHHPNDQTILEALVKALPPLTHD